jgi:uncharacterized membrane protein
MSKTWKWIIGILIALVVLAVIVAVPLGMHQYASRYATQNYAQGYQRDNDSDFGPGMMGRYPGGGYGHGGMMGRGFGYSGMMRGGFGFFPFGGIFTGLFGLAILGLAIYGIVALFNRRPAPVAVPAANVSPVATATCANCGKPAQEDWKTCPYCGNALENH